MSHLDDIMHEMSNERIIQNGKVVDSVRNLKAGDDLNQRKVTDNGSKSALDDLIGKSSNGGSKSALDDLFGEKSMNSGSKSALDDLIGKSSNGGSKSALDDLLGEKSTNANKSALDELLGEISGKSSNSLPNDQGQNSSALDTILSEHKEVSMNSTSVLNKLVLKKGHEPQLPKFKPNEFSVNQMSLNPDFAQSVKMDDLGVSEQPGKPVQPKVEEDFRGYANDQEFTTAVTMEYESLMKKFSELKTSKLKGKDCTSKISSKIFPFVVGILTKKMKCLVQPSDTSLILKVHSEEPGGNISVRVSDSTLFIIYDHVILGSVERIESWLQDLLSKKLLSVGVKTSLKELLLSNTHTIELEIGARKKFFTKEEDAFSMVMTDSEDLIKTPFADSCLQMLNFFEGENERKRKREEDFRQMKSFKSSGDMAATDGMSENSDDAELDALINRDVEYDPALQAMEALNCMLRDDLTVNINEDANYQFEYNGINYGRPKGMDSKFTLKHYQQKGVHWMVDRERRGSNSKEVKLHPFFKEFETPSGRKLYVNAEQGILCVEKVPSPPDPRGGILADQMGLGKTIQTIATMLINNKLDSHDGTNLIRSKATLIICPLTLVDQWASEIKRFTSPSLQVYAFQGTSRSRDIQHLLTYNVILTTYQTLSNEYAIHSKKKSLKKDKDYQSPLYVMKFQRVVLDEAHAIKNRKSAVHEACCNVAAARRWALTGTPIQNEVDDMFSLFKFLNLYPHGDWKWWSKNISKPFSKNNPSAMKNLHSTLKDILLRRTKTEKDGGKKILKLPEKYHHVVRLEFSEAEQIIYNTFEEHSKRKLVNYMEEDAVLSNMTKIFDMILHLRQVCCHASLPIGTYLKKSSAKLDAVFNAILDHGSSAYEPIVPSLPIILKSKKKKYLDLVKQDWRNSTKIESLIEHIQDFDPDTKCVCFSQWTSFMDLIEIAFQKAGITYVRLDGSMKRKDRDSALKRFESQNIQVGLISLKVGGVGLNLTWASVVFLMDLWWNPSVEEQAIDRVHRMGATKDIHVYRFVIRNSVEEKILLLQKSKSDISNTVLGDDESKQWAQLLSKTKKEKKLERVRDIKLLLGLEQITEEEEMELDYGHTNDPEYDPELEDNVDESMYQIDMSKVDQDDDWDF